MRELIKLKTFVQAHELVQIANRSSHTVYLEDDASNRVNANSIFGVIYMMYNPRIYISCDYKNKELQDFIDRVNQDDN